MRRVYILIVVAGLGALYPMQRWRDSAYPRQVITEESLYFASGPTLKRMSLGQDALLADLYWIRTVQYFGGKVDKSIAETGTWDTRAIRMDLLAPLLDITVALDPNATAAYSFGAIFLPERDPAAAISLLERGIAANPDNWRMYHDLGYIHWQRGDFEQAATWYDRGSQVEGAMWWMRDLAGLMRIRGGTRATAREIYRRYLESSEDENIKAQAEIRLKQIITLDERDVINELLQKHKTPTGECVTDLRVFAQRLRTAGLTLNENRLPVDPNGFPYQVEQRTCRARVAFESGIAQ